MPFFLPHKLFTPLDVLEMKEASDVCSLLCETLLAADQEELSPKHRWFFLKTHFVLHHSASVRCSPNRCEHGGLCRQFWTAFQCNCSDSGYSGATCHSCESPPHYHKDRSAKDRERDGGGTDAVSWFIRLLNGKGWGRANREIRMDETLNMMKMELQKSVHLLK